MKHQNAAATQKMADVAATIEARNFEVMESAAQLQQAQELFAKQQREAAAVIAAAQAILAQDQATLEAAQRSCVGREPIRAGTARLTIVSK